MSVNRRLPHVLVLPEDDANRELAVGFTLGEVAVGQMRVLPVAGGWLRVLECFHRDHLREMERYRERFMVLLIDFDRKPERREEAKAEIPAHLRDRVFIIGAIGQPEELKQGGRRTYEDIGKGLAEDCRDDTDTTWGNDLLRHNASEVERMRTHVRPILFPST